MADDRNIIESLIRNAYLIWTSRTFRMASKISGTCSILPIFFFGLQWIFSQQISLTPQGPTLGGYLCTGLGVSIQHGDSDARKRRALGMYSKL